MNRRKFIRPIWITLISFCWFMAFISWRFAYPTEIIADWILIAMISTVAFGVYLLTKGYGYYNKRTLERMEMNEQEQLCIDCDRVFSPYECKLHEGISDVSM